MQRGFYQDDDFEELLKEKADQYKMYPSDQVWKKIYRALHTRRKWYLVGFVLFFAGLAYYTIVELITPSSQKPLAKKDTSAVSAAPSAATEKARAVVIPFAAASSKQDRHSGNNPAHTPSFVINPDYIDDNPALVTTTVITPADAQNAIPSVEAPVYDLLTGVRKAEAKTIVAGRSTALSAAIAANAGSASQNNNSGNTDDKTTGTETNNTVQQEATSPVTTQVLPDVASSANPPEAENLIKLDQLPVETPYEYALPRTKRISWQWSFTPTMNYRKLKGDPNANIGSALNNVPLATRIEGDPDKLVNHKPAVGFEIGTHILYAVNQNLSFKAGLQFNYSRYNIQAYSSRTADLATITLSGSGSVRPEALTSYTHMHNFGGDQAEQLQNQYFQLSVPVGLEYRLFGNDKLQLKVGGTIQPTYLLNRNSYLITNDYTNYTKEPSLVRRWNLNASAEAFISYKTGDLQWQVGPQFRYQLLSSYITKYPIREYLMEYGVRIGVAKTIR
ncbi:MAG: outer membrane beta-barrel protein [Chitinophagaceae bacterium]